MGEINNKKWYDKIDGQTIGSAMLFAGSAIDLFGRQKSANEILADSGTSTGYGSGFSYEKINPIDAAGLFREWKGKALSNSLGMAGTGASIGSVAGPWGAAIGGAVGLVAGGIGSIFGRKSLQKLLEEAAHRQIAYNTAAKAGGMTLYLLQNEAPYINQGILYAYHGKDSGRIMPLYKTGKDMIHTSVGKMYGAPNAMGDYGESILDNIDDYKYATGHVIDERPGKRDANPVYTQDDTVILGNDVNWKTGKTFKTEAAPYTKQLELINKKFSKKNTPNSAMRGQLGLKTDLLQDAQIAKLKRPIVDKLKQLVDQQQSQHNIMRRYYNFDPRGYMPRYESGKDKIKFDMNALILQYPELDDEYMRVHKNKRLKVGDTGFMGIPESMPETPRDAMWEPAKKSTEGIVGDSNRILPIPARDTWIYNVPAMIGGLGQFLYARNSRPKTVNIYAANPYAQSVLQRLSLMKIDATPLVNDAILASKRGRYNALLSGGLTAGQRIAENIAREGQYMDAIAKIQRAVQELNNAYSSAYANAALAEGQKEMSERRAANQYNEEYAARSHAARQAGMQSGLYNIYAQLAQMGANRLKRNMFNSQLGVWQQELNNKKQ